MRRTPFAPIAIVLLLVGVLVTACTFRPRGGPSAGDPTPSPSPSSNVDPNDPILKVEWFTATVDGGGLKLCMGLTSFTFQMHVDGRRAAVGTPGASAYADFAPAAIVYGDLTGDGRAEAVLHMECGIRLAVPAMSSWIVRRDGDGSLRVLAEAKMTGWSWIEDGTLYGEPTDAREYRLGRMAAVRWNGSALVPVDTSARYPAMRSLDLSRVVAALPCHDLSAPDTLHLDFDPHLNAVGGAWLWSLDPAGWGSFWEQLGRTGRPYLVTDINCAPLRSSAEWNRRLVVLDLLPEGWAALAVLEPGPVQQWDLQRIDGRTVTLRQIEVSGEDHLVAYVWDGTRFLRQA